MHIHILGICGTFMGGIALLARAQGHTVTGQDLNVYPPMSTQLQEQGIDLIKGYEMTCFNDLKPDVVVIGNALSRGNEAVEYVLNQNIPYISGAQWLAENILQDRWVLAITGTHGKTTTSSMLAWILEYAGLNPGYLIGGVPENFGMSARYGEAPFFVVEADEYDTAFFDKRSKFVHYHPRTLVLNNLEFDHADIFDDLEAIKKQFHHLMRTVPGEGLVIYSKKEDAVEDVINRGCWSHSELIDSDDISKGWSTLLLKPEIEAPLDLIELDDAFQNSVNQNKGTDGSRFGVYWQGQLQGIVNWSLLGQHNVHNALVAIAAARHAGVPCKHAINALAEFKNVKRRLEIRGVVNGITVYDDFAHHPTAIETTIDGLRRKIGSERILAILEPRSNTMKMQVHNKALPDALAQADKVFMFVPDEFATKFDDTLELLGDKGHGYKDIEQLRAAVIAEASDSDHLLIMSNGSFQNIHQKILDSLNDR